jgi:hypothetical protein
MSSLSFRVRMPRATPPKPARPPRHNCAACWATAFALCCLLLAMLAYTIASVAFGAPV